MRLGPRPGMLSLLATAPLMTFFAVWGAEVGAGDRSAPAVLETRAERHLAVGGDQIEIALKLHNDDASPKTVPVDQIHLTASGHAPVSPISVSGDLAVQPETISEERLRFAVPAEADQVLLSLPGTAPRVLVISGPGRVTAPVTASPEPRAQDQDRSGHQHGNDSADHGH